MLRNLHPSSSPPLLDRSPFFCSFLFLTPLFLLNPLNGLSFHRKSVLNALFFFLESPPSFFWHRSSHSIFFPVASPPLGESPQTLGWLCYVFTTLSSVTVPVSLLVNLLSAGSSFSLLPQLLHWPPLLTSGTLPFFRWPPHTGCQVPRRSMVIFEKIHCHTASGTIGYFFSHPFPVLFSPFAAKKLPFFPNTCQFVMRRKDLPCIQEQCPLVGSSFLSLRLTDRNRSGSFFRFFEDFFCFEGGGGFSSFFFLPYNFLAAGFSYCYFGVLFTLRSPFLFFTKTGGLVAFIVKHFS